MEKKKQDVRKREGPMAECVSICVYLYVASHQRYFFSRIVVEQEQSEVEHHPQGFQGD